MKKQLAILTILLISEIVVCQNFYNKIDSIFQKKYEQDDFTGNVLVAEEGKIKYINTFGYANLADSLKLDFNSIFELASVSKQFTAAAIAILEQNNLVLAESPISTYLPELSHYSNVTISDLIHHTSGLPEYDEEDWTYDGKHFITNDSIIAYLAQKKPKLHFEPNIKYEYSNTGYVLLASIIERVSGKSFSDFLKEEIFEPVKMFHTQIYRRRYSPETIINCAEGYVFSDSLTKNILPDKNPDFDYVIHLDGIQGDGMVNSTLLDLLKWDRVLYENQLLNKAYQEKLFTPQILGDGTFNNYGYGWEIHDSNMGKIVSHSGGWPGYVTYIERHLKTDKTIIILQNNFNNFSLPIKTIRKLLYKKKI